MTEAPIFEDYINARIHAWATGSVSCVFNDTEYRRDQDDHEISECIGGTPADCTKCRRVFRLVYGDPPLNHPADRVARFLKYYNGRDAIIIACVAGAATDHKDVALTVSDLRYLVEFHAARRGLITPTGK